MNLRSAWAFCTISLILPNLKSYAGVLNEETRQKRLEFLAKGRHNCEFNISIGHNFSSATYNTDLKAKFYTETGTIALYDIFDKKKYYRLPTLSSPGFVFSANDLLDEHDYRIISGDVEDFQDLLDLKDSLDLKFFGSVIPVQFDLNYIFGRRFKIGISEQIALGFYYHLSSPNLGTLLYNIKTDKKASDIILMKRFIHTNLKKKLSIDSRTYLNTGFKLLDYNPYSLWLNIQNGFAVKMGNKISLKQFLMLGYTGNLYLSLEKYLSRHTKVFVNVGCGCNIYYDDEPFKDAISQLMVLDLSLLNLSFGISFGSNDGRYEDYMYQKVERDFYIDKYQTTFDYYDECFPIPEF